MTNSSQIWRHPCAIAAVAVAAVLLVPQPARAQDCPTAQSAAHGFVVERNEAQKSEVFRADQGLVRVVTRYNGETLLETTQYQGLFMLERLDRGRRTKFDPRTDLKTLFPLKPGAQLHAKFVTERDGNFGRLYVELDVRKPEDFFVGACKYTVLRIDRRKVEQRGAAAIRLHRTLFARPRARARARIQASGPSDACRQVRPHLSAEKLTALKIEVRSRRP